MIDKRVILKPGKEKSLKMHRHPWIFSGAIDSLPEIEPGEILPIYSFEKKFLAQGYFHPKNSLAGRVLSFDKKPIEEIVEESLLKAAHLRHLFFNSLETNAYRLVNAEADGLPGLIVDVYDDVFVLQISTAGMQRLKPLILEKIIDLFHPTCIYEKSLSSARSVEGLEPFEGFLFGDPVEEKVIKENQILFVAPITKGQKTGFFLDQREMRKKIAEIAKDKKVLNCFSYTGGFSLYALQGKAQHVVSVDISKTACCYLEKNTILNKVDVSKHSIVCCDVFQFIEKTAVFDFDVVIIDPPAFAKQRKDIEAAIRGYKELNFRAFAKAKAGSLLLTSSCSHFIHADLFQKTIFQAASAANRTVKILLKHIQAIDHPVSLFHPEGEYLKSLLLYIE